MLTADFNEALGLIICERAGDLLAKRQGLNSLKDTAEMECSSDWVSVPEKVRFFSRLRLSLFLRLNVFQCSWRNLLLRALG